MVLKKVYRKSTGRFEYALVSKVNPNKILYYFGTKKPNKSEFLKQERRIQFFKNLKGRKTFSSFPKKRVFKQYRSRRKKGGQRYWISNKKSKYLKKLPSYKIKIMDLNDFGGMNHYAARELNFKPIPKRDELFIEKDKPKFMESTLIHELTEAELMKKGMRYKPAHKKAIDIEIKAGLVPKKILLKNNKYLFNQLKEKINNG